MKVYLFLPDFKQFVRTLGFNSEDDTHPVLYFENDELIYFYKYIKGVLYYVFLDKTDLPEDIRIPELKTEFKAIEVPAEILSLNSMRQFNGTIS